MLVFTARPGYAMPWEDRAGHERLTLEPLSEDETAEMVRLVLGVRDLSPAVRELVVSRAEGNPFFIEELTRYLRERGDAADLPDTVQDLLAARIDRLRDPLKRLLQVAAVLGREFTAPLLQAVAGVPDVAAQVGELVAHELLREKDLLPVPTYAFSQPLIQQVAYQSLLTRSRAELHARAGAALERLYAGHLDDVVEEIAEHYSRSPERRPAIHALQRAGDRARLLERCEEVIAEFVLDGFRLPAAFAYLLQLLQSRGSQCGHGYPCVPVLVLGILDPPRFPRQTRPRYHGGNVRRLTMPLLDHFLEPVSEEIDWHCFSSAWLVHLTDHLYERIPHDYSAFEFIKSPVPTCVDVEVYPDMGPSPWRSACTWESRCSATSSK